MATTIFPSELMNYSLSLQTTISNHYFNMDNVNNFSTASVSNINTTRLYEIPSTLSISNLDGYGSESGGVITIDGIDDENNGWTNKSNKEDIINNGFVQTTFCILYTNIFVLGIFGNVLVCYVVFRNKAMQTVTNLFITNLALSDVLLCVLAVPFTPLYTFLRGWVFGKALCHLVPYAQGCSVYISTLTLTSIAIDRFFVIIYPFHPRMKLSTCISIIISIWVISLMITLPYGFFVKLYPSNYSGVNTVYCEEDWPDEWYRKIFGSVTSSLQFLIPFAIISICYVCVSFKLNDRVNARPGSRNSRREEADRDRKKRTNRMLIAMVAIFGISWLPINVVNIFNDFYSKSQDWKYYTVIFFVAHCTAMSSTCYNPFLYAWLNENFRKEFKQVLPCFNPSSSRSLINVGTKNQETSVLKSKKCCNGNDTLQETLLQSSTPQSMRQNAIIPRGPTAYDDNILNIKPLPIISSPPSCNQSKIQSELCENNKLLMQSSIDEVLLSDIQPNIEILIATETIKLPSGVLETPFDNPSLPNLINNNNGELLSPVDQNNFGWKKNYL